MKLFALLYTVLITIGSIPAIAEELPADAQKMLEDLGSPEVQQKNNNKTRRCLYGGSKKITVSLLDGATVFSGEYNNCREAGATRDGYYEIIVRNGEVIGESSKRSVNGELHDAVRSGDVSKASDLIKKKADVNYAEKIKISGGGHVAGWTPLMSAVITSNVRMVELLVKAGAWINYMNSSAITALWLAANNGSLDIVNYLIAHNAYVDNSNNEDVTPLMAAAINGQSAIVKSLLNAKAAINAIHKDGDTALMCALAKHHTDIALLLLDAGSDVNIRNRYGVTALLIAVAENDEVMVQRLLHSKADLTVRTDNGKNALDIAMGKGNENIIRILKQAIPPS